MIRRILALACVLALCTAPAFAQEDQPRAGRYAKDTELAALAEGLEVRTETSFAWGGLPLLEVAEDSVLKSLLGALRVDTRAAGGTGSGYRAFDLLLKDVSVLDLSLQAQDGVYYEQSNLIGGQTVAFTPEEFRYFVARLSARSGGALPTNLDIVLTLVMQSLAGTELAVDETTMSEALSVYLGWQEHALTKTEITRPIVQIPGLYGTRALVTEITRAEILSLAQAYSALLAENEALWLEAVRAELPGASEDTLTEKAKEIGQAMHDLPATLEALLAPTLAPTEYREVYGEDGALVVKQLDISLPEEGNVYLEWVPREDGIPPVFASLTLGGSVLTLVLTREDGTPTISAGEARVVNRLLAQLSYVEPGTMLDATLTYAEDARTREGRETITKGTSIMVESAALLGEGTVLTITADGTESTSGAIGGKYARKDETVWRVKGLGFDEKTVLTVRGRTTIEAANPPADPVLDQVVRPAQMDDQALTEWLAGTQVSLMQTIYTIIGRLPSDVAGYLLGQMQGK